MNDNIESNNEMSVSAPEEVKGGGGVGDGDGDGVGVGGEVKPKTEAEKRKVARKQMTFGQKLWYDWVKPIAPIIIILLLCRSVLWDMNDVPSESMYPTIVVGDRLFVQKSTYGFRVPFSPWWVTQSEAGPKRGQIIITFSPEDGIRLVKRLIAVPGDVLEISYMGQLRINGEAATYTPLDKAALSPFDVKPFKKTRLDPDPYQDYDYYIEELLGHKRVVMLARERAWKLRGKPDLRAIANSWTIGKPGTKYTVPKDKYIVMGDNRMNSKDSRYFGPIERGEIIGHATHVLFSRDGFITPRGGRWWLDMQSFGELKSE